MRTAVWLPALGVLSVAVVGAHVVQPGGGLPPRLREVMDVAHVVGFAAITWLVADRAVRYAQSRQRSIWPLFAAALAFTALLAVVSEGSQTFVRREADLNDLLRDAGGIAGGALLCLALRQRIRPASLWALAGCAILAVAMWQPGRVVLASAMAQTRLPELIGFESALDEVLVVGYQATVLRRAVGDDWPLAGYLAEVEPTQDGFAGISFPRLSADWSGYTHISFVIAARDEGAQLATIRIHDRQHDRRYEDRFNRELELDTVPRRVRIALEEVANAPAGRRLDLTRIEEVIVFVIAPDSGAFLIDDLRLE